MTLLNTVDANANQVHFGDCIQHTLYMNDLVKGFITINVL